MAKLDETFDSSTVPEREEFEVLPPGPQTLMIVNSELKDTKAKPGKGAGQMIVLEIDVVDGQYSGRKLFERLNIKNDSEKAVEIAYRTLGEIVKAVGKTTIKDTTELHNKRFTGVLAVEPPKPYTKDGVEQMGKAQNSIKKYLPYSGQQASSAEVSPKTVESPKATDAAPWKRAK
jgi:hypothetical protein